VRDKPGSGKETYIRRDEDQSPEGDLTFRQENWTLIPGWPQVFIRPLKLYLPPRNKKLFPKLQAANQVTVELMEIVFLLNKHGECLHFSIRSIQINLTGA